MNTSIRMLAAWMTAAASLYAGTTTAGPLGTTSQILISAASVGQAAPSATEPKDNRQEAGDLLSRARLAMAEDDLDAAETLIAAAEALDVHYGLLHAGDTPKKARHDLEQQRQAADRGPSFPSRLLSHLSPKSSPPTDPFSGISSNPSTPRPPGGVLELAGSLEPPALMGGFPAEESAPVPASLGVNPVRPLAPPSQSYMPSPIGTLGDTEWSGGNPMRLSSVLAGVRADSSSGSEALWDNGESLLLEARRALASGDVQQAGQLVDRARLRQVNYAPLDDTPDKVESAIRQYQEITAEPGETEAQRRRKVRVLMGQAEALLRYNDFQSAEQLARQASEERLAYSPFEARPQDLLDRIAAARQQGNRATAPPAPGTALAESSGLAGLAPAAKEQAVELSRAARAALGAGQLEQAESLVHQAELLRVPDSAYAPGEERPGLVLLDIRRASLHDQPQPSPAGGQLVNPATGAVPADRTASRALYDPSNDLTRNVHASHEVLQSLAATEPLELAQAVPALTPPEAVPHGELVPPLADVAAHLGPRFFAEGESALRAGDTQAAYQYFQQAAEYFHELDPLTQQRLQERLQLFSVPTADGGSVGPIDSLVDETAAKQQALARQVSADIAHQAASARSLLQSDPGAALAMMEEARRAVEMTGLEPAVREQLLRLVDRHLADMQWYIEQNRPLLELEQENRLTLEQIEREQRLMLETQEQLALLVEDFNQKMREQRYAEAEVVAKRAVELAPNELVSRQLLTQAKLIRQHFSNLALQAEKEEGFLTQLDNVLQASVPIDDYNHYRFPDAKTWEEISSIRSRLMRQQGRRRSEGELEIQRKLRTPVSLSFSDRPLSEVLDHLSRLADVDIFMDPLGLAAEGVTSDTHVSIDIRHEIALENALNLLLEPLRLGHVIKDEVLKITSEQLCDGEVYVVTYNVADLVVPLPNFPPSDVGLASAYQKALGNVGFGGPYGMSVPPLAMMASKDGSQSSAAINPGLLAQITAPGQPTVGVGNLPAGLGLGGPGGSSSADFGNLMDLITQTIEPESWDSVGGTGSVAPFDTNLSIVVSQTQDVHEQIVDLLEQLRRMQDLQVTIEVRFITLNDTFFERLGVDFDFDIDDGIDRPYQVFGQADPEADPGYVTDLTANTGVARNVMDRDGGDSVMVGLGLPDIFTADLDIPFRQGSFQLAVPQFGGFAADAGAQIGFAILSDIEAFFFINAAQGDRRSNVLQAPKVTLFNGQQATVSDTSQSPFVASVVPVVGDFAAAQQPVIVVLSEGTFMTVQAVVSADRRFVRLTVVPFFSEIGEVNTFQFTGSETTTTSTSAEGIQEDPNDSSKSSDSATVTREGTTVQLPTFSYVQVSTTVNVPDGGTVLLGGIKRLSEGRSEFGVPILAKLPYINRLFKNVSIGRETQSLMMMVTPRIIIQEEEQLAQTGFEE